MPHSVTGTVPPVPGVPGDPVEVVVDPAPVQVPSALPSSAADTAQAETRTNTGTSPDDVAVADDGSHVLLALPSTATTTLHALTGTTPSTGALWLTSLVGRSFVSG